MTKITEYFNLENIVSWTKSVYELIFFPRKFFAVLERKSNNELISQLFFYFIVYSAFFILINSDFQNEKLLKQSTIAFILNSFSVLSVLFVSFLLFGKAKTKIVLVYLTSLLLVFTPILIICIALLINTENYFFDLIRNIFIFIILIYANYLIVFLITNNWKTIIKFIALNYLIINCFYFISNTYSVDKYIPVKSSDPIFNEYYELFSNLECKEELPGVLFYSYFKDSTYYGFALTKVPSDSTATNTDSEKLEFYKKGLQSNLNYLSKVESELNFDRNKYILRLYKKYFTNIQSTIKQEYLYPEDLRKYGYKLNFRFLPNDTILNYHKIIDIDALISERQFLADYHNGLLKTKRTVEIPYYIAEYSHFFLGNFLLRKYNEKYFSPEIPVTSFEEI